MRRILIDNARRKRAQRHGGGQERVNLEDIELAAEMPEDDLLALNDALEKLARLDKQKAELIKLRFFIGLTLEETAKLLGISLATAKRHWTFARAWLYAEIRANKT